MAGAAQERGGSSESAAARLREHDRIPQVSIHFFCSAPDTLASARHAVADRRMSRAQAAVHEGGLEAAIGFYANSRTPHMVVLETLADREQVLAQLEALADVCSPGTKVIIIGHVNDVDLYRQLIENGVHDYVVAPVDPLRMIERIARQFKTESGSKLGRTVAFIGAVGGAGSSTVAQNVAAQIARDKDTHVILVDLDLPFGSAGLAFGIDDKQGLAQALQGASRLDEALLERLLTKCGDRLSVLTAPGALDQTHDIDQDGVGRVLEVAQATSPFVILDMPHVWTSWARSTLLAADDVVITSPPTLIGLRNTKNLFDLIRSSRLNDPAPKIVLSQVGIRKRAEIAQDKFASALKIEIAAVIPFDAAMFSAAANDGRMAIEVSPKSPAARAVATIAEAVSGRPPAKRHRTGFSFTRFRRG